MRAVKSIALTMAPASDALKSRTHFQGICVIGLLFDLSLRRERGIMSRKTYSGMGCLLEMRLAELVHPGGL